MADATRGPLFSQPGAQWLITNLTQRVHPTQNEKYKHGNFVSRRNAQWRSLATSRIRPWEWPVLQSFTFLEVFSVQIPRKRCTYITKPDVSVGERSSSDAVNSHVHTKSCLSLLHMKDTFTKENFCTSPLETNFNINAPEPNLVVNGSVIFNSAVHASGKWRRYEITETKRLSTLRVTFYSLAKYCCRF